MSEISFPDSWAESSLSSLISIQGLISDGDWVESKDQDPSGLVRLIQLADIGDGDFRDKSDRYMTHDKANALNCTYLKQGDVLIARMPDPLGRACIFPGVNQDAVTVVDVCLIRTGNNSAMSNELLKYWINSPVIRSRIELNASGTTRKRITRKKLEEFNFPVPPLAEQKVIVDKLDNLLSQVESIKARLERIPEILKQFRQSVLTAAVSGKLFDQDEKYKSITVEDTWFHVVEGRKHWQQYKFSEVVKIVGGSQPPKAEFRYEPMEGYIRLIQIRDYKSDDHKVFIPRKLAKRFVTKDDVMIGRYGPPIFQILRGLEGAYNVALMKAEPNKDLIDREYLFWFLQNSQIYNYIEAGSDRTAGQSGVNKKHLESYPIFLPPLSEQIEIVAKVKNLFACSDMIEQQVQSALDRVNNLTQSILAKAFRGELTAEWRKANPDLISGENSAEALLDRIKAERSARPVTKRGKGKA